MRFIGAFITFIATFAASHGASAAELGRPVDWQMGFQEAATPVMEFLTDFHTWLLWLITAISLFVLVLLIIVMVRFNARANPVPSKTTHNTVIEVAWTVVPVLILIAIAIPSFRLLYLQRDIPEADMTVKAIGNQWYWDYEYPDHGDISFSALLLPKEEVEERRKKEPDTPWLLATDNPVVVPAGKVVRLIVTANDVLHAWTIPSFGVKIDAIPGRLNEAWFRAEIPGIYYGQCSELCGKDHAYMPIEVRVVPQKYFDRWVTRTQEAGLEEANRMLAADMAGMEDVAALAGD